MAKIIEIQESMDFSNKGINKNNIVETSSLIKNNSELNNLDISSNKINDIGLKLILEAISNKAIDTLNLSNITINSEGIKYLGKFLISNNTIKHLDLSNNKLTREKMKLLLDALTNDCKIVYLDLSENSIADSGLDILIQIII